MKTRGALPAENGTVDYSGMPASRSADLRRPGRFRTIEAVLEALCSTGSMAGIQVFAVQHVQHSLVPLVDALHVAGIAPDAVTIVAKSYSTQHEAVTALRLRGADVDDPERMLDPCRSFEAELEDRVACALDRVGKKASGETRVLVLDEGGVASRLLLRRPLLVPRVAVVEQTTRGAVWADRAGVPFPVVDVARSPAKAELEGPLIARSMLAGIHRALRQIEGGESPRQVGLIGYGTIGRRLADLLRGAGHLVSVHDHTPARVEQAEEAGFRTQRPSEMLRSVEVLIGCTGGRILDERDLARVERPMSLFNAASSDLEFPFWSHRQAIHIVGGDPPADAWRPWRNHYRIGRNPQHVLVAGGFPINFFATDEPIPAVEFQLTRALMLAGAAQALSARPGVEPLRADFQQVVVGAHTASTTRGEQFS